MWGKVAAFVVFVALPFLLYTVWLATASGGAGGSFWGWWMTGRVMASPIFCGWVLGAFIGAFLSRFGAMKHC